jgi:hypothetical protein
MSQNHEWLSLLDELNDLTQLNQPLSEFVFHGTTLERARKIKSNGFRLSEVLLRDPVATRADRPITHQVWSHGTFWAKSGVAGWCATYRSEGCKDAIPALIAVKLCDLESSGRLIQDEQSLDVPMLNYQGVSPSEMYARWQESNQDWRSCFEIFGAFACLGSPRRDQIFVISQAADILQILTSKASMLMR